MSRGPATLVVVALLVTLALAVPFAGATTNEITMSGFSEEPGEVGLVLLWAQATNVTAYEANVTFDPDVVTVVTAGQRDFPTPEETVDRENGWVSLSASREEPVDYPVLASLVVRVSSDAEPGTETELSFVEADTTLTNATDGELTIDAFGTGAVSVLQPDTPAPTATPTPAPSPATTPTATSTDTPTPTPTDTPTPTPTPTPTDASTPTPTPTDASTPTPTPTTTPTPTQMPSPTPTETVTQTQTVAPSPTPTATASPEPTLTTTTANGPGFGLAVTLLAILVAAGLARRSRGR